MPRPVLPHRRGGLAALALAAVAAALPATPTAAQPIVQPLPNPAADRLTEALRTLARDPVGLDALLSAGESSLTLGDIDAAEGFFVRAEAVAPVDGRVKAGRAAVLLRRDRPVEALALFAEAERLGAPPSLQAAERGLAHDLVGDNTKAQAAYHSALSQAPNDEVIRRLAISQAISGNRAASEATLLPQLQRQDRAAFRARAFALAILGQADEAVSIAETMLPQRLSSRMSPYLRYMPRLTRAQQAQAAHFGRFPRATEIGRDDPAVAALSAAAAPAVVEQNTDARLVPSGAPLGPRRTSPATQSQPRAVELPPVGQPAIGLASPVTSPPSVPDLATAFADLAMAPRSAPATSAGAVDITTIAVRRETSPPPRPAAPSHPSRHWVQVATGRDAGALSFDWRRIKGRAGGLLDSANPHLAAWGQSTRLLAGPFDGTAEAQALVTALKQVGIESFRHTSGAGEEVRPLR